MELASRLQTKPHCFPKASTTHWTFTGPLARQRLPPPARSHNGRKIASDLGSPVSWIQKRRAIFFFLASGFWLLAFGFWLLAFGFWLLASGFWLASCFWLLASGSWLASGFWLVQCHPKCSTTKPAKYVLTFDFRKKIPLNNNVCSSFAIRKQFTGTTRIQKNHL